MNPAWSFCPPSPERIRKTNTQGSVEKYPPRLYTVIYPLGGKSLGKTSLAFLLLTKIYFPPLNN